jgi:hypothetical protein
MVWVGKKIDSCFAKSKACKQRRMLTASDVSFMELHTHNPGRSLVT